MSNRELLMIAAKGAAECLNGTVEDGGEGIRVDLPGDELAVALNPADDPAAMAPLHRLAELVRRSVGRVHLAAIPPAVAEQVLGSRDSVLLVRVEATWQSAAPVSRRFGFAAPLGREGLRPISADDCAILAAAVGDSGERVESAPLEAAWSRVLRGAQLEIAAGTEETKAKLMSLQSRRRRDIEAVFRARQMSADDLPGEGDEAASAARLERERRAALDQAEAYYDPNRLGVEMRVSLALVIHSRTSRKRGRRGE